MKKLTTLLLLTALALWAADFWQTKPYTDWTDKDLQKILTDSPWAKKTTMPVVGGPGGGARSLSGGGIAESAAGGGGRGGRGGGGGGGDDGGAPAPISAGGGGRGGGGGADVGGDAASITPAVQLIIRWQTALPIKQALVKSKYKAEAGTSAEGKQFIERPEQFYVIDITGLPAYVRPANDQAKQALIQTTTLGFKDSSIPAADAQFDMPRGPNVEAFFLFPRSVTFAPDKEVEFTTKFGKTTVKTKFRLKDMVINGKLDL